MSRLALAITLSHPGYSAQLRPPFLGAAVTGATRCANCTWGHENENPPFWGVMKTHRASDAKHVGGSTPLDRTAPRQHPSAKSELPADGADRSHSPAPCSWASEGQLAGESSHGRRHLGAPRGWGAGTPPAGLRGPDQVCPLQPLLWPDGSFPVVTRSEDNPSRCPGPHEALALPGSCGSGLVTVTVGIYPRPEF